MPRRRPKTDPEVMVAGPSAAWLDMFAGRIAAVEGLGRRAAATKALRVWGQRMAWAELAGLGGARLHDRHPDVVTTVRDRWSAIAGRLIEEEP